MTWTACPNPDCHGGYVNKGRDPQWDELCRTCGGDGEVAALTAGPRGSRRTGGSVTASIVSLHSLRVQHDVEEILATIDGYSDLEKSQLATLLGDGLHRLGYHRHDEDRMDHPSLFSRQSSFDGLEGA